MEAENDLPHVDENKDLRYEAFGYLIVNMLRGSRGELKNMSHEDVCDYVYNTGVSLHNIPKIIARNEPLWDGVLIEINSLDPSGSADEWGHWVSQLLLGFKQEPPERAIKIHQHLVDEALLKQQPRPWGSWSFFNQK